MNNEKFKAIDLAKFSLKVGGLAPAVLNTIMLGEKLDGVHIDFSHGDVDAFPPTPGSDEAWKEGFSRGGSQAYTEYRGSAEIRNRLAARLGKFTGRPIEANSELIITPGTQGALFLALAQRLMLGQKLL